MLRAGPTTPAPHGNKVARERHNVGFLAAQLKRGAAKADQTITFNALANQAVDAPDLTLEAKASSGLPVAFSLDLNSTGCQLNGNTVTFLAEGTCVINAIQAGYDSYYAAPPPDGHLPSDRVVLTMA